MNKLKEQPLYNTISNKVLKQVMINDNTPRVTVSFYKYFNIDNPTIFRDELYKNFNEIGVLGRIYIAYEGINAQISVPKCNYEKFKDLLYTSAEELNNIRINVAIEEKTLSFWVLRIKVREKIVADGITDHNFNISKVGKYLKAEQVNEMINDTNTIFVDMRNHYEYEVGHFRNAIQIPSDTFKEQLPMAVNMLQDQRDKNIVMYCTGGIRCEKASAYMIYNGFENVYHVEGGIIEYTRKAKEQNLPLQFIGKNFVFDERMGERITNDIVSTCHQCNMPCDEHINCANDNCHLLFIQCSNCKVIYESCCSENCVVESKLTQEEQIALRKGKKNFKRFFNKSRNNPLRQA